MDKNRLQPPSPSEIERLEAHIHYMAAVLDQIEDYRQQQLASAFSHMAQKHVERECARRVEKVLAELARLQADWAHLADKVQDSPEEAVIRDEIARCLLEG